MTNYICINGKKAELTEEQLKALGIELPKASPFERVKEDEIFYYIASTGEIGTTRECLNGFDTKCFISANYCTDKSLMEQRALHETLNRLLWRYSMEHDGNKITWNCSNNAKWYIYYSIVYKEWDVADAYTSFNIDIFFYSEEIALNAIEEIVKPFMEAHPDFKF